MIPDEDGAAIAEVVVQATAGQYAGPKVPQTQAREQSGKAPHDPEAQPRPLEDRRSGHSCQSQAGGQGRDPEEFPPMPEHVQESIPSSRIETA
jgi:hypothetical protein